MRKIIAVIALFTAFCVKAQETSNKTRFAFHSINQVGLLTGEGGNAFQIQTVNGVKAKGFFAGIGLGIDEYQTRSIPVFLDLRKQLKESGKTPFVYADAGMHFIWPKEKNDMIKYEDAGFYYDMGLGYSIPVKGNAILFSAGYSFKSFSAKEYTNYYYWWAGLSEEYILKDYELRRISMKVAFSF